MRTPAFVTIRRGLALVTAALLAFLFLPGTAQAYERPTSATSTVLTLPSDLTATLAGSGATAVSAASPVAMNTYGYLNSDFQPDLGPTTAALELETSFNGCLVFVSSCPNLGSLTLSFSQPLTDPTLHIAGLGQSILLTGFRQVNFHAVLTLATAGITLSKAAGSELAVTSTTISTVNPNVSPSCTSFGSNGSSTPAGCGSVRLNGTGITAVSFDISGSVFQVSGPPSGVLSGAARDAFGVSVTVGQDYGDAPSAYESSAARHLNSDLRLGSGITTDNDGVPNSTSSPLAGPGAIADSDDAISTGFPTGIVGESTTYTKTVALSGVSRSARLCGWVDFDRDNSFEFSERDCQNVAASQTSATFALTGTPTSDGASYARFRLGYTAAQVESPTGSADSGEVEDYSVNFLTASPALGLSKTADRLSTDTVGQITTYTFLATNTGNVAINNVTITDPKPGLSPLSCTPTQPATLNPGASLNCTATRATTQADMNNGGVIANTAIANGSSAAGPVSSPPAIAHVQAQQQPATTIAKSAAPTSFTAPGQTITYTLTVTNTGNVPLSNTQVTDPRLSGLSCAPAQGSTMNPGATKTCTGTYLTTQNDVNLGGVNNTASVSGAPPSAGPNATDVDNLFVPGPQRNPDLSLIKAANPTSYSGPGETISYTFTATNTGNVTLTAVSIADPKPGLSTLNCTPSQPTALAPGASLTCTATRATTQGDVNAGSVTNSATVTGTPPNGPPISRFGSVIVAGPIRTPAIDLVKTAAPTTVSAPGEVVTYTLVAQNTGNVTLNGVTVTDPKPGLSPLNCSPAQPATLNPGATISCTATRSTTQADINAGAIDNTASAAAGSPAGTAFDTGSATVTASRTSAVNLVKTASPTLYTAVGNTISYTITATNAGNTTLFNMAITDPMPGLSPLNCSPSQPVNRNPGQTVVCTATRTITQADLDAGQLGNTATVNAVAPGGEQVSATAPNQVSGAQTRSLSLAKSAAQSTVTAAGQTVGYTFVATNTGNVTLTNVTVTDPQPGLSPLNCTPTQPAILDPGDALSCTASYAATQGDINAAGVSNTATTRGEGPGGDPSNPADDVTAADSTMTPSPDSPEITLTKTASPTTVANAGDLVAYTFAATNTGNVTLNSVTITDPLPDLTDQSCTPTQPAVLDPGATLTCTASRAATQADIDAGTILNTATATGLSPVGVPVGDDDSAAVTAAADPQLALSKVASRSSVDAAGQVVDYTLVAQNQGNVTLTEVMIDDPLPDLTTLSCNRSVPVTLAPSEAMTCTATRLVTQADMASGAIVNTATVTATPAGEVDAVTDVDDAVVIIGAAPAISLVKTVDDESVRAGDVVTYTLAAKNTGNTTLSGVVITDPLHGLSELHCENTAPAVLVPGAALTCTATYQARPGDGERGEVVNTATVTGTVDGEAVVSATAGVDVEVQPAATIHRPALLALAETGGPYLVWPAVAGLLTLGGAALLVTAQLRRR